MAFSKKSVIQAMRYILPLSLLLLVAACTTEPESVSQSESVDAPNVQATVQAEVANQLAVARVSIPLSQAPV